MIELVLGLVICYVCNTIENEMRTLKRVRDAKKKLFTDDRPIYENV